MATSTALPFSASTFSALPFSTSAFSDLPFSAFALAPSFPSPLTASPELFPPLDAFAAFARPMILELFEVRFGLVSSPFSDREVSISGSSDSVVLTDLPVQQPSVCYFSDENKNEITTTVELPAFPCDEMQGVTSIVHSPSFLAFASYVLLFPALSLFPELDFVPSEGAPTSERGPSSPSPPDRASWMPSARPIGARRCLRCQDNCTTAGTILWR